MKKPIIGDTRTIDTRAIDSKTIETSSINTIAIKAIDTRSARRKPTIIDSNEIEIDTKTFDSFNTKQSKGRRRKLIKKATHV